MSLPNDPQLAFVGLGNMGKFMALNLANYLSEKKKPTLKVWNRTSSKAKSLVEESNGKVVAVDSLEEIANSSDIIISSLANDAIVKEVITELLKSVRKGKKTVFIETSTIYPTLTSECGDEKKGGWG